MLPDAPANAASSTVSAIFYSLIGICKTQGLIPEEYLRAVY
jgi:hypothetical protein